MGGSGVIVTGATGFLGRNLVAAIHGEGPIWGIARGSPKLRGVSFPADVRWLSADIARRDDVRGAFEEIGRAGGAEILFHFAGHYDFTGERSPEYERTNVHGMRIVLEAARDHGIRDVVFSSSVAACAFPPVGTAITEDSRPGGETPYAESKRAGEAMLAEFRGAFRSWIVRFGALYSDWCEYEPLFRFLEAWLSRPPRSRILAGKGRSAVPYLHVRDAVDFLRSLLLRRDALDPSRVLLASPDGATSHLEIYEAATAAHYGERIRPIFLPAPLCRSGLRVREALRRVVGFQAWERPWMGAMIDRRLAVDGSRTRDVVGWAPNPRLGIVRRMPFLIQNRKSFPAEWQGHNHAALKSVRFHENLRVHRLLEAEAPRLIDELTDYMLDPARTHRFPAMRRLGRETLLVDSGTILEALLDSVRTGDKSIFRVACQELAKRRRKDGITLDEMTSALDALNDLSVLFLTTKRSDAGWSLALYDHMTMTAQFGVDAVYDVFEGVAEP